LASRREERREEIAFHILRLVEKDPNITTREIAQKVGISNGAAYYCLIALIDKGYVKLKNFTRSKQKTAYFYKITSSGLKEKAILAVQFLKIMRQDYYDLRVEIEQLEKELDISRQSPIGSKKGSIGG
jgi:EPS-associated MarR family transcriptional regulator